MTTQRKAKRSRRAPMMCTLFAVAIAFTGTAPELKAAPKPDEQLLAAEQILSDLGYWVLKVDGIPDTSTRHAITAFQKVEGIERTGVLTAALLENMQFASTPLAVKGVRHASLGDLYYPNYFYGGVAIHGSLSVPPAPASHGCVRIPRFADRAFSGMVWVGMEVFVYD